MGSTFSSLIEVENNSHVIRFISVSDINISDPFWNSFISFEYNPSYSSLEDKTLSEQLKKVSTVSFHNIKVLIDVILFRFNELEENLSANLIEKDSLYLKQFQNGLFIIRYSLKYLLAKSQISTFLTDGSETLQNLICMLQEFSVGNSVTEITYALHVEAVLIMTIIIYNEGNKELIEIINKCLNSQIQVMSDFWSSNIFQEHFCEQKNPVKNTLLTDIESKTEKSAMTSILHYVSFGWYDTQNTMDSLTPKSLSTHSILLIIKICFSSSISETLKNEIYTSDNSRFQDLLSYIKEHFSNESIILLFYLLVYKNNNFRSFVLNQTEFKDLIVPLIKNIYNLSSTNINIVYMSLIILLILTEDERFNSRINQEFVTDTCWIKEKSFSNVSLGSLIVWVICRVIQNNFIQTGDKYIQTNCLASLANMSSKFFNLHPQASEQMVIVIIVLQKKRNMLLRTKSINQCDDIKEKLLVTEETLQMMVEIINSALIFSLTNNPDMIHTFLYHKKQFSILKEISNTKSYASNIDSILAYFTSKMEKDLGKSVSSESDVLKIIKKYCPSINKFNNFKSFPQLKFKYVEDESAEEFFTPYILKLFHKYTNFSVNLESVVSVELSPLNCLA